MTDYTKLFLLGSGTHGKAWVVHKKDNFNYKNVLKEVNLSNLNDKDIKQAVVEAELLAECKHENVIRYREAFVTREPFWSLCIVMEYATCGDLHKCITQRNGLFFPNEIVYLWLEQIMAALDYIHSKGILHRDVKPQNLFLTNQNTLKLGDFGIARILNNETDKAFTFIGTPFYISPEIYNQRPYCFKSDMWSAGCVVYEMCCLHLPFSGSSLGQLAAKVERGVFSPLPSHCDQVVHFLVERLLDPDPEGRPAAKDVLELLAVKRGGSGDTQITDDSMEGACKSSDRGRNRVKEDMGPKVDGITYTNVKKAKAKRGSLASPELSSLIRHQRIQSAERSRASSVDDSHKSPVQKKKAPRCNILQTPQACEKKTICDVNNAGIDAGIKTSDTTSTARLVGRSIYELHQSSPSSLCAGDVRHCLETMFGKEAMDRIVKGVKERTNLDELNALSGFDQSLLPTFLLYSHLAGTL